VGFFTPEELIDARIKSAFCDIDPRWCEPDESSLFSRVFYTYILHGGTIVPVVAGRGLTSENHDSYCRAIIEAVADG